MKQSLYKVTDNRPLTADVYRMTLFGDTTEITMPGQFVNIKLPGHYLRRPISVCDWDANSFVIIYKQVGSGTAMLAQMQPGQELDILTGMGHGFRTQPKNEEHPLDIGTQPLLIGGGVGVPPLFALAKQLIAECKPPRVILGFNTAAEIFYVDEFTALGLDVTVTTADGSAGIKGFVTDALPADNSYSYVFACGPRPMLKAIYDNTACSGQYSMEERMGCGFGACMGCTCHTTVGDKKVCRHGPVFLKEELIW